MSDLMELATSVVEQAQRGEGMEVYVTRGTENEVRAYDGAIESLTSADSSGVGIRVILDGPEGEGSRLGFAWAGSLDPDVVQDALRDARDNARYATPDPDVVLAEPDGMAAVEQDLWDDAVLSTPMEDKIALALELERATRGADPRVRQVSSADYSDGRVEVALASTTGLRSTARRTSAFLSSSIRPRPWTTPSCGPPGSSGLKRRARAVARWSSIPASCPRCFRWWPPRCPGRRWSRAARSSWAGSASRWPMPP
jgi:PmbA protein